MSKWREFKDRDALDTELAATLCELLRKDIATRGSASLAVSGGSTPIGLFACLSNCELDWSRVWVTLVDDRWVEPDHEDSNERLVRQHLLKNHASTAKFVGLKSPGENASNSLQRTASRLTLLPRPFTCVVLGMGGDGHTASWFPQASNLQALLDPGGELEVGATQPVTAPHQRITLTLPAVLNSRSIIIHITGDEKRDVLQAASKACYPIAAILEQHISPVSIWWAP